MRWHLPRRGGADRLGPHAFATPAWDHNHFAVSGSAPDHVLLSNDTRKCIRPALKSPSSQKRPALARYSQRVLLRTTATRPPLRSTAFRTSARRCSGVRYSRPLMLCSRSPSRKPSSCSLLTSSTTLRSLSRACAHSRSGARACFDGWHGAACKTCSAILNIVYLSCCDGSRQPVSSVQLMLAYTVNCCWHVAAFQWQRCFAVLCTAPAAMSPESTATSGACPAWTDCINQQRSRRQQMAKRSHSTLVLLQIVTAELEECAQTTSPLVQTAALAAGPPRTHPWLFGTACCSKRASDTSLRSRRKASF